MTEWRDQVSSDVRDGLELAQHHALAEAEKRLAQRGRFEPFAVVLDDRQQVRVVGMNASKAIDVSASDLAVASVKATRGHGTTYLLVAIEHRNGPRVMTVTDYRRRGWLRRRLTLGDSHESLTERKIWVETE